MRIIGSIIFIFGCLLLLMGILSEKQISINDVNLTNKRITLIAWGTFIALGGLFIGVLDFLEYK